MSPSDAQDVLDYIDWVWLFNEMPDGPWLTDDDQARSLWDSYFVGEDG